MVEQVREFLRHAAAAQHGIRDGISGVWGYPQRGRGAREAHGPGRPYSGWPFLAIITMLFSGAQLVMLGIIGEYLGRLFLSMNETPQCVIKESRGVGVECGGDFHG